MLQAANELQKASVVLKSDLDDVTSVDEMVDAGKQLCRELEGFTDFVQTVRQQQLVLVANLQLANEDSTSVEAVLQTTRTLSQLEHPISKIDGAFSGKRIREPLPPDVIQNPYDSAVCLPFDDSVFGKHVGTICPLHSYGTAIFCEEDTERHWPITITTCPTGDGLKVVRIFKELFVEARLRAPLQFLKSIRIRLVESELWKVSSQLRLLQLEAGADLIREGQVAKHVYLVKSGELRVYSSELRSPRKGTPLKEVAEVGVGDMLEEVVWNQERSSWVYGNTVRAMVKCQAPLLQLY